MTRFQLFYQRWGEGCGSTQCARANRVVLVRGSIPCDILFIGEAPGQSEDVIGRPFVGPAGKLLDRIIEDALSGITANESVPKTLGKDRPSKLAFTNIVGCIPREENGDKATEPDYDQIMACRPRLEEFVRLADPKLVVAVGALARDYTDQTVKDSCRLHTGIRKCEIVHPAAILRANVAARGLMVQRATVTLRNAVEEL
jgi:uracil-DNA glycosylase family 4